MIKYVCLFLAIVIGLSIGADQYFVAIIGLVFTSLMIILRSKSRFSRTSKQGNFTTVIRYPSSVQQSKIIEIFKNRTTYLALKRVNIINDDFNEIAFSIVIDSYKNIEDLTNEILILNNKITLDIVDTSGVLGA